MVVGQLSGRAAGPQSRQGGAELALGGVYFLTFYVVNSPLALETVEGWTKDQSFKWLN